MPTKHAQQMQKRHLTDPQQSHKNRTKVSQDALHTYKNISTRRTTEAQETHKRWHNICTKMLNRRITHTQTHARQIHNARPTLLGNTRTIQAHLTHKRRQKNKLTTLAKQKHNKWRTLVQHTPNNNCTTVGQQMHIGRSVHTQHMRIWDAEQMHHTHPTEAQQSHKRQTIDAQNMHNRRTTHLPQSQQQSNYNRTTVAQRMHNGLPTHAQYKHKTRTIEPQRKSNSYTNRCATDEHNSHNRRRTVAPVPRNSQQTHYSPTRIEQLLQNRCTTDAQQDAQHTHKRRTTRAQRCLTNA